MTHSPQQVEVRTDHRLTTTDDTVATPSDAKQLHAWPDAMPSAGEPVTVAMMDSGIHPKLVENHPWFEHVTVGKRYDAVGDGTKKDLVGHGSAGASLIGRLAADPIAAATGDGTPVEFYDVQIFGASGRTGFGAIENGYQWLTQHADEIDVVNMSWGARKDVPAINRLHEKLIAAGVYDSVAAGNTGSEGGSPATSPKAFSVGAVDQNGDLTRFTSRDPNQDNPDVAAIGKNVKLARAPGTSMGTPLGDQFVKASGTSFSAPLTSAAYVIALYKRLASWDKEFQAAAPDIPGSRADGEGLLKLSPALGGETPNPPENPPERTGSMVVGEYPIVGEVALMNGNLLPNGQYSVDVQRDSAETFTLKVERQ